MLLTASQTNKSPLSSWPRDQLSALLKAAEKEARQRSSRERLKSYQPYPKQAEFHAKGKTDRERLLMAANRFGKSICGAAEMAIHLTGLYPDWWVGRRFETAIQAWAGGVTGESTRDIVQEKLLGPPDREEDWGTGFIPKACIGPHDNARGVANLVDTLSVKHVTNEWSTLQFKSYNQGREKWQGTARHVIWLDEECPEDIYFEAFTRTTDLDGMVYLTFTPLLGMSNVVKLFLSDSDIEALRKFAA